jgi:NAD(P)-dependent dehydrogenase (short-subunit alcohol dehydrogenase family)
MRLKDKVAVVTGGASGIGRATVERFVAEGATVGVVDRDAEKLGQLAAEVPGVTVFAADVADEAACRRIVGELTAAHGRIRVLVTCAGISVSKTVVDTTPEEWARVFRTSVDGTYVWMRAVLPQMEAGDAVVTVASQLALAGGRRNAAHIAAKGAVVSLTRSVALDMAPARVRVNTVLPGAIDTPALAANLSRQPDPEAAREWFRARHPLGRFGEAEEVASAILYLASDEASFTTGVALPIDGGWLAA